MKLGVISDTHGSLTAWQNAYNSCFHDVDIIIHCGDVLYHGPRNPLPEGYNPQGLAKELQKIPQPIIFAKGNCDTEIDQLVLDYPLESPYAHVFTPNMKVLITHGHHWDPAQPPSNLSKGYNLIISGHTHLPILQRTPDRILLNPGSPALPKNDPPVPTVAVIDENRIRIVHAITGIEINFLDL